MRTEFSHQPVMMEEVLGALQPRAGGLYVDGTLGGGGHAAAILETSSPTGWLYGCDCDSGAVSEARQRLAAYPGRFELRQGNFAGLADWIPASECDGVLLDLGISTLQLDDAGRGFSFQLDGPLDMRKDRTRGSTAADLVNGASAEELAKIFWEFGGERQSRRLARAIVRERERQRFETTRQLSGLIERLMPREGKRAHPATRLFQALRIAVNDELGSLVPGLIAGLRVLRPGGRLAVIAFHSLEDRMVKDFGRVRARDYTFPGLIDVPELRVAQAPEVRWVTRKAVKPADAEISRNPRSRSAQLRVMEKLRDAQAEVGRPKT